MRRYTTAPFAVLNLLFDILQVFLILRFVAKLFQANAENGIMRFLYSVTEPLINPFRGIFPATAVSGYPVEWATIIAMMFYALIMILLMRVIAFLIMPAQTEDPNRQLPRLRL